MSLPSGYRKLEYIESTGTQYIDTGLTVNKSDTYEYTMNAQLYGNNYGGANGYMQFLSGIVGGQRAEIKVSYNGSTHVEQVYVNSVLNSSTDWTSEYSGTNVKLGIFRLGNAGNVWWTDGAAQSGKLYSLRITKSGALVRNFIPCENKDGVAGLWDDVGSKFYANSGTGVFLTGARFIRKLPEGYTELDSIKSSGTQYIDTGVHAKGNQTKVVVDVNITYGSGWIMVLGSYDSSAYFSWWGNGSNLYVYYGGSNQYRAGLSGRGILTADKNVWSYSDKTMTFTQGTFTASSTMQLFSIANGGNYVKATMQLYSCQIYESAVLIRDFIPCKNASGVVGLYDIANNQFYANAGSGSFVAGSVVDPTVVLVPKITAASFSVNPVNINTATILSVTVSEETIQLEPTKYYAGEFYSGEV